MATQPETRQEARLLAALGEIARALRGIRDRIFWLGLLVSFYIAVALSPLSCGQDDTDRPGAWARKSGMRVYTDARTGCQYVAPGGNAALTPRLGWVSEGSRSAALRDLDQVVATGQEISGRWYSGPGKASPDAWGAQPAASSLVGKRLLDIGGALARAIPEPAIPGSPLASLAAAASDACARLVALASVVAEREGLAGGGPAPGSAGNEPPRTEPLDEGG